MEPLRIRRVSTRPLARGFTLIELMVVLVIIMVITTVVLTNQNTFNKTLILANTAYDIALTLRSTETYGISSRAVGTAANVGYGIHVESGTRSSFILFADIAGGTSCAGQHPDCKPGDHVYTSADASPATQTYNLNNGMTIQNFCAFTGLSGSCENPSGSYSGGLSSLDITFSRPNPDAFISTNGSYTGTISAACLTIASPRGDAERYVSVAASGQIIANATSCSWP